MPAFIGRKPVIAIEEWRFFYWDEDEKGRSCQIVLPEGLRQIRKNAFKNCTNLTDIVLPKTLEEIGEEAFSGCRSLQKVVLPEGITCIPDQMFSGCKELSSVVVPESVTEIEWEAFSGCEKLKEIKLPGNVRSIRTGYWYSGERETISVLVPRGSITEKTIQRTKIPYQLV